MANPKIVGFRYEFIGLSTDTKPLPDDNSAVADGVTFYEADTSKTYVYCQGQWYEKTGGN